MESTKCTSSMIVPEVLTKDNYEDWRIFMKSYLLGKGLWDIVEGSECKPEPTNLEFKAWRMRNGEAVHAILISCGEKALSLIRERDSAKDAWDHLASMFHKQISSDAPETNSSDSEVSSDAPETNSSDGEVSSDAPEAPETNSSDGEVSSDAPETNSSDGEEEMAATDIGAGYREAIRRAVHSSDWETTKSLLLEKYPDSISAIISPKQGTVLNVAVTTGNLQLVNRLLELMTPHDIETAIKSFPVTPLFLAACFGYTKIAKVLVGKHPHSLEIPWYNGYLPIVIACAVSHEDTTRFLYGVTRKEALIEGNGTQGASLINLAIIAGMYDIAIDLLRNYPQLSITIDSLGMTTISCLSNMRNAFASGEHQSIWQQWIYSITDIKRIHKKQKNHADSLTVLKIVCSQLSSLDEPKLEELKVRGCLHRATELGIVEIVSEIAKIKRDFLFTKRDGINILSIAIMHRQEKVFNFLCGIGELRSAFILDRDNNGNTILHHAGMLPSLSQQGKMAGAALQMQHELQWFQEVEEMLPLQYRYLHNNKGLTPRELFTKKHTELVEKGEKWMKDTANSCMIVATLIATVTFAAAFTVPGGNNQELGFPIFLRRNLFLLFIISDALSLFSSSTSVLMFLSIYTSRYAEEDFLKSLPKRLIIGLSTLFFSIATMMVAFCATMFLILGKHYKWAAILITFLAAVPVTLFIRLQFPLFLDMILSTYGPGLFRGKGKKHLDMLDYSVV